MSNLVIYSHTKPTFGSVSVPFLCFFCQLKMIKLLTYGLVVFLNCHLRKHFRQEPVPQVTSAPGHTIVLRLPLTAAKKLQHNHCGLSDTVKPLLHILKPQPAHPLQLYVYINCAM